MTATGKSPRKPTPGLLLAIGWGLAVAWTAIVFEVRAPQIRLSDPVMQALMLPVWVVSLGLVVVGTFGLMTFTKSIPTRCFLTIMAAIVQCVCFWFSMAVLGIFFLLLVGPDM